MKISVATLRKKKACADQLKTFEDIFGREPVEITEALCVAHADKFDWNWAVANLLPKPLWAAYEAGEAALRAAYEAGVAPLRAAYKAGEAALFGRLASS